MRKLGAARSLAPVRYVFELKTNTCDIPINHFSFKNRSLIALADFHVSGIPEMRKRPVLSVTCGYYGGDLHKAGERGENVADLTGVFEPVPVVLVWIISDWLKG